MKALKALNFLVVSSLFPVMTSAAPSPLTGLSMFNKPQSSLALSRFGFELKQIPANWIYKTTSAQSPASGNLVIELGSSDADSLQSLNFRIEKASPKLKIENYVRQFLRDYNQYGFEVVQLRSYKKSQKPFVVVDLTQKNKTHRSRQVFFHDKDQVVIATCVDKFEQFDETLKLCNQAIDSIAWLKSE